MKKVELKKILFDGPHLHDRGPQIYFCGPHFIENKTVLAGRRLTIGGQFADPCFRVINIFFYNCGHST